MHEGSRPLAWDRLGNLRRQTLLMNAGQECVALRQAGLDVSRTRPGWSEQDPRCWWEAVRATLDELAGAHGDEMAQVRGIGLSGRMHGATLLDANDRVLRPCILWNDGRSVAECAALDARADFRGIGGNLVMPGFTAPKIEWVRIHEQDVFERVANVLLPKDCVRLCLAGEHLSDMSDSAGTHWMDVGGRCWSSELLDATGHSERHMPGLVEGSEQAGRLRPELADRWGIAVPPAIAGGGGDNAASGAGVGAVAPGTGFVSIGTSGVLLVATEGFAPNVDAALHWQAIEARHFACVLVPSHFARMGYPIHSRRTEQLSWHMSCRRRSVTGKPRQDSSRGGGAVLPTPPVRGWPRPANGDMTSQSQDPTDFGRARPERMPAEPLTGCCRIAQPRSHFPET